MTTPEERAQDFPRRCFTPEEFAYLKTRSEFIKATQHLLTIGDAVSAVELGGELIRGTWETNEYRTSEFIEQQRNTPSAPTAIGFASTRSESLAQVPWKTVHTFSIETNTISLVTETGPKIFSYLTEDQAKAAYEQWLAPVPPAERILKSVGTARP